MHRLGLVACLLAACGANVSGDDDNPATDAGGASDTQPTDTGADARLCAGGDQSMTAPDGSCFLFFSAPRTFADAQALCLANGSQVALIKSQALHDAAAQLVGALDTYIGLTDQTTEGTFVWVDGTALAFANWEPPDEPNDGGGVYPEDCAIIAGARPGKLWDDRPCSPVPNVGGGNYATLCQF